MVLKNTANLGPSLKTSRILVTIKKTIDARRLMSGLHRLRERRVLVQKLITIIKFGRKEQDKSLPVTTFI